MRPRETLVHLFAQNGCRGFGLRQAVGRHFAVEAGRQHAACGAVLQPVEHLAHDAKARWHQARSITGVDALGQHFDFERAAGHAAQAGGQPELVVVAGTAVQANHQAYIAQAWTQCVYIGQQVIRAGLFARLDQTHDARVGCVLVFKRLHGGHAGVHRIAIVCTATPIELAVFIFGRPWAQVVAPAIELGLLVHVAVHQHSLGGLCLGRWDVEKHHRRAPWQMDDFQLQAFHLLRLDPLRGVAQHSL